MRLRHRLISQPNITTTTATELAGVVYNLLFLKMKSHIRGRMVCIKYFMFVSNAIVFISGLGLVTIGGLGEILYGDIDHISQVGFSSASAILVIIGCFIVIVGLSGCYGAIRESVNTLKVFCYLLVLIILLEIALTTWIYFAHIKVFTVLKSFLSKVLSRYEMDHDVQSLIDEVQTKYSCCGAAGYTDWFDSKWNQNRQNFSISIWIDNVPHSCCLQNTSHLKTCGDNIGTLSKPVSKFIHTEGCFHYLQNIILHHMGTAVSVGAAVVMLEVMALLSTCCLRRAIKAGVDREIGDTVGLVV